MSDVCKTSERSLAIVVPSQGNRHTLTPLLQSIDAARDRQDKLFVALNGNHSISRDASQFDVVNVPSGYASSRNYAARHAISSGATGVVFIDDDVVATPGDIAKFLNYVRGLPGRLVSFPVRKVFPGTASILARRVLQPKTSGSAQPPVLPATFLYVPAAAFYISEFPDALDFTGGEDTIFTARCRQNGFDLERLQWDGPFEEHPARRTTSYELAGRVLAAKAAIQIDARWPVERWRISKHVRGLRWILRAAALTAAIHPVLPYYVAAGAARALREVRLLPVKEGGEWQSFRRISID